MTIDIEVSRQLLWADQSPWALGLLELVDQLTEVLATRIEGEKDPSRKSLYLEILIDQLAVIGRLSDQESDVEGELDKLRSLRDSLQV